MYVQSLLDEMTSPGPGNYNGPRRPYVTPSDSDRKIMNGGGGRPDDGKTDGDYADDINKDIYQNLKKSNARIEELRKKQIGEDTYSQYLKDSLKNTQARETNIDLSPLMALSDNWFGGNMAGSYNAGFTGDKKQAQILALQNALGKRQGQLSDAEQKSIADQIGKEYYGQQVMGGMIDSPAAPSQSENMAVSRESRALRTAIGTEVKDAGMSDAVTGLQKMHRLQQFIKENNGIPMYGNAYIEYQRLHKDLLLTEKERQALGALAGPDIGVIEGYIGPGSAGGVISAKLLGQTPQGHVDALGKNIKTIGGEIDKFYGRLHRSYSDAPEAKRYIGAYEDDYRKALSDIGSSDKTKSGSDAPRVGKASPDVAQPRTPGINPDLERELGNRGLFDLIKQREAIEVYRSGVRK